MKSMTGYGYGIFKSEEYIIEVEIKSYNNRYLDISHNINALLSSFEGYIDSEIKKIASRGHLDVSAKLRILVSNQLLSLDERLLDEYKGIFSKIEAITGKSPSFSDYSSIEGMIVSEKNTNQEIYKPGLESALNDALSMLDASKLRDGEGTRVDLVRLGSGFEDSIEFVYGKTAELEDFFKSTLIKKYNELLSDAKADDPRFMAEVAALLVKYSINEEISRLKTHIKEYKRLMDETSPVGKQLDFLCQEMNRECNTIASKSQLVEINLQVVKMKDNLENIREQIRNIE